MFAARSSAVGWIVLIGIWFSRVEQSSAFISGTLCTLRIQRSVDRSRIDFQLRRRSLQRDDRFKRFICCLDSLQDVDRSLGKIGKRLPGLSPSGSWPSDEKPRVVGPGVGGEEPVSFAWFVHAFNFAVFNPQTMILLVLSNLAVLLCGKVLVTKALKCHTMHPLTVVEFISGEFLHLRWGTNISILTTGQ